MPNYRYQPLMFEQKAKNEIVVEDGEVLTRIVRTDGSIVYLAGEHDNTPQAGKFRHRRNGPAQIFSDGTKEWWIDGKMHREGYPAHVRGDGSWIWYHLGKIHRDDGPAICFKDYDGSRNQPGVDIYEWWCHGKKHREDGPAIEITNGSFVYMVNGIVHRNDGPARYDALTKKYEWARNDRFHTFKSWCILNDTLTDEEKLFLKLKYT